MANNTVIVALPARDERVWKVSSEKKPHLTLLFLGETEKVKNLDDIIQFVDHAVTLSEHGGFMLNVDYRDTLGDDKADVLFFEKDPWSFGWIESFRHQLLQNESIRSAWESVEQYPEWTPHLTLGYPETPAKEDDSDHGIHWVSFDRIAVWTGDYEGPEFRLRWSERMGDSAAAWAATAQEGERHILEHYGVKGMKWGQRKAQDRSWGKGEAKKSMWDPEGHSLRSDVAKVLLLPMIPPLGIAAIPANVRLIRAGARNIDSKLLDMEEKKFTKEAQSAKNFVEINNRASDRINREIPGINAKHPGDLTKSAAKQKAYDADIEKLLQDSYREAANSIGNKNRTMHLDLDFKNDGMDFVIKAVEGRPKPIPKRVKHAGTDDELSGYDIEVAGHIPRSATGHFLLADPVEHAMDLGAEYLMHYGVKGMKWGVRRDARITRAHMEALEKERRLREKRPAKDVRAVATIGPSKRKPGTIKTDGGEDHPPTEDAVKVAEARQKIKKSGLASLTNQELQLVERRLNLENNVKRLSGDQRSAGQKFIDGLLGKDPNRKNPTVAVETQAGEAAREALTTAAAETIRRRAGR